MLQKWMPIVESTYIGTIQPTSKDQVSAYAVLVRYSVMTAEIWFTLSTHLCCSVTIGKNVRVTEASETLCWFMMFWWVDFWRNFIRSKRVIYLTLLMYSGLQGNRSLLHLADRRPFHFEDIVCSHSISPCCWNIGYQTLLQHYCCDRRDGDYETSQRQIEVTDLAQASSLDGHCRQDIHR